MDLAQLCDLEHLLHQDEADSASTDRDRAIGRRIRDRLALEGEVAASSPSTNGPERRRIFAEYVLERRRHGLLPGLRLAQGLEMATWISVCVSFLIGVSTARAVLNYNGETPVNLFWFLGTLVLLQAALLLVLFLVMVRSAPSERSPPLGLFGGLMARLASARILHRRSGGLTEEQSHSWARLAARRGLYADLARWMLFARVQRCGVAFNGGALLTTILLLTFTDLAFSWSTTLGLSPELVQRGFAFLAGPFGWVTDEVVPSFDVVRAIQWTRLSGGHFVGGLTLPEAAQHAQSFGPFLLLSLASFGLIPRLIALFYCEWRARRARLGVRQNTLVHERLLERLFPRSLERVAVAEAPPRPEVVVQSDERLELTSKVQTLSPTPAGAVATPDAPPSAPPRPKRLAPTAAKVAALDASPCEVVVTWGSLRVAPDSPGLAVLRRSAPVLVRAGGADLATEERDLVPVAARRVERAFFLVEEGVPPTKDLVAYLKRLRAAAGAHTPVEVIVLMADGQWSRSLDELLMWDRVVTEVADPDLGLRRPPERAS